MSLFDSKEAGEVSPQRLILVGPPKAGKSSLLLEAAEEFKVLWIDLESSKDLLLDNGSDKQLSNIEYIQIPDTAINPCGIRTILAMLKSTTPGYICKDHGGWNCNLCRAKKDEFFPIDLKNMTAADGWIIVLDSATQLSISILQNLCKNSEIDLASALVDDRVTFGLWGAQGGTLDIIFSIIQNGPWHFATTCHETMGEEKDKTKKIIPTIGTKNYGAMVNKYFSTVIRVYKKGKEHCYSSLTTDSTMTQTGSRRNIDINAEGVTLADYFKPVNEIQEKIIKVSRRRPTTAKAKTAGAVKKSSNVASGVTSSLNLKDKFKKH